MATFPGFGVSGYRTLAGEPQWIPLDPAVTVFLGGNNSGKSNVLRLVSSHLAAFFGSLKEGRPLGGFDVRLDAPRDSGDQGLDVLWPLDVRRIFENERWNRARHDVERVLELPELNQLGGMVSLPFKSSSLLTPLEITQEAARAIQESTSHIVNWPHASNQLTQSSGGASGEDALRVLLMLREWCIPPPETVFVPPSRAVSAGADNQEWDFSGAGMLHQLRRLKAPQFFEDELRDRANALTEDLRVLLEDDRLEFMVPHDNATVTVMLGERWFPLQSLGTGTEHAFVILAARHVYPERLLCLEEPDAHLHPRLQRRLISLLREAGSRQVAIATHSAHIIDAADTVVAIRLDSSRSSIEVVGDHALFAALRSLGYRASDLLQANCIVWVEGPSDRIYLLHWLRGVAPELVEGVDFSIAFYGGALLARLSASPEGVDDPTLVDLWRINRRMWIVMDSDSGKGELKPGVERLQSEVAGAGSGGTWITAGYTVENYIEPELLEACVRDLHPSVDRLIDKSSGVDPLAQLRRADGEPFKSVDKVAIALAVCEHPANLTILDLEARICELATFIRDAAVEAAAAAPVVAEPVPSPE